MKHFVTLLAFATMTLIAAPFAQAQHKHAEHASHAMVETKAYACPKCEMASMKAGKCACGEEMKAVNGRVAYVCAHCNVSSKKAGNCTKCKMPMEKSLVTYACEACDVSSAKPGACKMCKAPLKKHIMPIH